MNMATLRNPGPGITLGANRRERTEHSVRLGIRIVLLLVVATLMVMTIPTVATAATITGDGKLEELAAVPAVEKVDVGKERTVVTLAGAGPIAIEYGDVLDPGRPAGLLGYGVLAGVALGLLRKSLHVVMMLLRIAR